MARKNTKTTPPVAASQAATAEVKEPSWFRSDRTWANATTINVSRITGSTFYLPAYQRGVVWSTEMQAAFCNSVMAGLPVPMLLLWERHIPGVGSHTVVLDGQQRITALGGRMLRPDGSENPNPQVYLDPATGRWGADPGRWGVTCRDLVGMGITGYLRRYRELPDGSEEQEQWNALYFGRDMFQFRNIPAYVIDSRATPEFLVEAFRSVNRPGVPFDEAEIERLIQSAMDIG